MRAAYLAAAVAALWVQPASAVEYLFALHGYVPVEEELNYGSDQSTWPDECDGQIICDPPSFFYDLNLAGTLVRGGSTNGIDFTFIGGNLDAREQISGTARYLGDGAYQGLSLDYWKDSCPCVGDGPFLLIRGETTAFSIHQVVPAPVPEPATWAMLLVGFGAVGAALRRRSKLRSTRPAALSIRLYPN